MYESSQQLTHTFRFTSGQLELDEGLVLGQADSLQPLPSTTACIEYCFVVQDVR